jgi:hypothetical protein
MVAPEQGKYDLVKLKPMDSKDTLHELPPAPVAQGTALR